MSNPYLQRRGTAAAWTSANTLLGQGEFGLVLDGAGNTISLKIGNGTDRWNTLPSFSFGGAVDLSPYSTTTAMNTAIAAFAVPLSRTINGVALSGDINLTSQFVQNAMTSTTTKAPSVDAVQAALDAITAGSNGPVATTFATAVSLDKVQGRQMGAHLMAGNIDFTVNGSPAAVIDGNCETTLYPDGVSQATFSGFVNPDTFTSSLSNIMHLVFSVRPGLGGAVGEKLVFGRLGAAFGAPTLVSATVANATPSVIDLVWSRAMSATLSAAAAFSVAGGTHALTGHTVDGSNAAITHLATSTAFVHGETCTLSYTQPGSNKMQDTIGSLVVNFTGSPITDNVSSGSSTLSIANGVVYTAFNITTFTNMDEYIIFEDWSVVAGMKTGSLLGTTNFNYYGGATRSNTIGNIPIINWTDSTAGTGGHPTGDNTRGQSTGICSSTNIVTGTEGGQVITNIQLDTGTHKFRVFLRDLEFGARIRATLGDGSHAPVMPTAYSNGDTNVYFDITVQASAPTTLQVEGFPTNLTSSAISFVGILAFH